MTSQISEFGFAPRASVRGSNAFVFRLFMRSIIFTALVILSSAAGVVFGQQPPAVKPQDTVVLTDGREKTGLVVKETFREISLQDPKGAVENIPIANVRSVRFADSPVFIGAGDSACGRGDYKRALEIYKAALAEIEAKKIRPVFRQYALYGVARALSGLGQNDDAAKAFNDLLSKEPETKFLREAHHGLIAALRAKADLAGASAAVKRAAEDAKSKGLGEEFTILIELQKVGLLEDDKKWVEAYSEYSGLLRRAEKFPNLVSLARLGMGRSILNNKEVERARKYFLDLSRSASTSLLLAGAYNGLGDCAYKTAEGSKKVDDYREALLMYTKASVLGFPAPGELTAEHERAIFMTGCCNQILAGLSSEEAARQFFLRAAEQAFRELLAEYPSSRYAGDANKRLKDIQAGIATTEPE